MPTQLPPEIMLMVLEQIHDLSTLCALTEVHRSAVEPLLEHRFRKPVTELFKGVNSEELYKYTDAILTAERDPPANLSALENLFSAFLQSSLEGDLSTPSQPRWMLEDLVSLVEMIDFFVPFCKHVFLRDFALESDRPLSSGEDLRIRRALLRFQLYTQIFHQPGATDSIVAAKDWEQRVLEQQFFWTRLETVEIEECRCIYAMLFEVLSRIHNQRLDTPDTSEMSGKRGLYLLQPILLDLPFSALHASYAHNFVKYAFTGFRSVSLLTRRFSGSPRKSLRKRYQPSDPDREWNFHMQKKDYDDCLTQNNLVVTREDATNWKGIGHVFWDVDRVNRMRPYLVEKRQGRRSRAKDWLSDKIDFDCAPDCSLCSGGSDQRIFHPTRSSIYHKF
ncbi:hypothetical protein ACLMJK_005797 [Lecanora helva]